MGDGLGRNLYVKAVTVSIDSTTMAEREAIANENSCMISAKVARIGLKLIFAKHRLKHLALLCCIMGKC